MKKLCLCILCGIVIMSLPGCSLLSEPTAQTSITSMTKAVRKYDDYIFVGDSRFVGMEEALNDYVDDDVEIVAKVGQGLAWLKKTAPDLYSRTGKTIIFNLGVNDLYNASEYAEYFNNMPKDFLANNTIIFMTVNPVDEQKEEKFGYGIRNSDIEKFNDVMKEKLDKQYFHIIDTNSYIQLNNFVTTDGLHYNYKTYRMIFDRAVECCEKKDYIKR